MKLLSLTLMCLSLWLSGCFLFDNFEPAPPEVLTKNMVCIAFTDSSFNLIPNDSVQISSFRFLENDSQIYQAQFVENNFNFDIDHILDTLLVNKIFFGFNANRFLVMPFNPEFESNSYHLIENGQTIDTLVLEEMKAEVVLLHDDNTFNYDYDEPKVAQNTLSSAEIIWDDKLNILFITVFK